MRVLRYDRVCLVERGFFYSLFLMELGKIFLGVWIIIVNLEIKGLLGDLYFGEIWVYSVYNVSGYFIIYGDEFFQLDYFNLRLSFGDIQIIWVCIGYLGFLWRIEFIDVNGECYDVFYVVGVLDEVMELWGMWYYLIDIEILVIRVYKSVMECVVFIWINLLVVVVELDGLE